MCGKCKEGTCQHLVTPTESWEEKFGERFKHRIHCRMTNICGCGLDDIKSFIKEVREEALSSHISIDEVVGWCEEMREDTHGVVEPIKTTDGRIGGIVNHGKNLALSSLRERLMAYRNEK